MRITAGWMMGMAALVATAYGCGDDSSDGEVDSAVADVFMTPVADGCIDDVSAGVHDYMCGELKYHVTIPEACVEEPCGLVLDVHGWFMVGEEELAETEIDALGIEHGYIAVHPTATLGPGRLSAEPEPSWRAGTDDPALHAFMEDILEIFHVDRSRVHLMGFSQGGAMTWRMLCAYPEMFASVSPGAAATGDFNSLPGGGICADGSMPAQQVPVLFMHGTLDALSPPSVALAQHETMVEGWEMQEDEVLSEDDMHTWTRYTNAEGNTYEYIAHDYVSSLMFLDGHCFPGSPTGSILSCRDDAAFKWGPAAMDFFLAHPKP